MQNKIEELDLVNGMELFILPLPIQDEEKKIYYLHVEQMWIKNINKILMKGLTEFDHICHSGLMKKYFDNKVGNENFQPIRRYFSYVLYKNKLHIITYGKTIRDIIDNAGELFDDFYYFKKLIVNIKYVYGFKNYDETYISNKYYNISDNIIELFNRIKKDKTILNIIDENSFGKHQEEVFKLYNILGIDLKSYLRGFKIRKLMINI